MKVWFIVLLLCVLFLTIGFLFGLEFFMIIGFALIPSLILPPLNRLLTCHIKDDKERERTRNELFNYEIDNLNFGDKRMNYTYNKMIYKDKIEKDVKRLLK